MVFGFVKGLVGQTVLGNVQTGGMDGLPGAEGAAGRAPPRGGRRPTIWEREARRFLTHIPHIQQSQVPEFSRRREFQCVISKPFSATPSNLSTCAWSSVSFG